MLRIEWPSSRGEDRGIQRKILRIEGKSCARFLNLMNEPYDFSGVVC